jgi:hypothetical protein
MGGGRRAEEKVLKKKMKGMERQEKEITRERKNLVALTVPRSRSAS